ncbi:hypothetical protein FZEAL_4582 [Fusarium zealandicum]|uniref:2EXR domain-containing protein n=1 Tax=Fusarium zealandicum TaxID=1053134 RepID=A0A8H4UMC8_9HYPO|nr:hypothetical protein FZEAL_4582 [Fusarium zealandicum]
MASPAPRETSLLPLELRRKIWELSLWSSATLPDPGVYVARTSPKPELHAELNVQNPYSPSMATSRESRQISLENLPRVRDYNPATDILYVGTESFWDFCQLCELETWPSRIRHLALALMLSEMAHWLPMALKYMVMLETISVVYPQTSGEVDSHPEDVVPTRACKVLTKLADDRMDGALRIDADYVLDDPCGKFLLSGTRLSQSILPL